MEWSVMLYGCKTWTIKAIYVQKSKHLSVVWKKMKNIKWLDHVKKEKVLRLIEEERSMVNTILKRQRQWLGHLLKRNSLFTKVLERRCKREKAKGRHMQQLLDNLLNGKYTTK